MSWLKKIFGIQQEQSNDLPADFSPPSEVIGVLSKTILDLITPIPEKFQQNAYF